METLNSPNITFENCDIKCSKSVIDSDIPIPINMINNTIRNGYISDMVSNKGKTEIIIGNGVNCSLRKFLDLDISTYKFLTWDFVKIFNERVRLNKHFPKMYNELKNLNGMGNDDFDKINKILEKAKGDYNNNKHYYDLLKCEMKNYISLAFSYYQNILNKKNISEWAFTKYLDLKKDDINCVVSLNYDLVVEEVLSYLAIKYRRFGVINEQEGIPIFKPHGSIDYTHNGINLPVRYPINTVCYGNDTLLKSISNNELLKPRNAVDIVPPTQSTEISDFQWVKCGYEYLKKYGKNIEKLIICGVSYWGCDKMEIDKMIESIHPNCNVININPDKTSPGICEFKNIIVSKVGVKRYKQLDDIKELLEL